MWARFVSVLAGAWLMAAPDVLGYSGAVSTSDRIVGPLIVTFAITAMWEVTRGLRRINTVLGFWVLIAPIVFASPPAAIVSGIVSGVVVLLASLVKGSTKHSYAGGWRSLLE